MEESSFPITRSPSGDSSTTQPGLGVGSLPIIAPHSGSTLGSVAKIILLPF